MSLDFHLAPDDGPLDCTESDSLCAAPDGQTARPSGVLTEISLAQPLQTKSDCQPLRRK